MAISTEFAPEIADNVDNYSDLWNSGRLHCNSQIKRISLENVHQQSQVSKEKKPCQTVTIAKFLWYI